ncbi:hypothetical protein WN51_02847 [Melipona quadrifasciata]|uniref:Uncharacterized protein n=1 Tax=Melipona quadrifasciata TaxID=166423 RepID=A0A0N0BJS8_9HYME|nr:hypothetical protein WN51_02847 [Melipona quadrifasciata]
MEKEDVVGKQTLVRRMSNMLRDGSNNEPPMLFRHTSMQKIRHCCENLNLFPYLLYSFENSKSHPIACKLHYCLQQFIQLITARIQSLLYDIHAKKVQTAEPPKITESVSKLTPRFRTRRDQKPKQSRRLFLRLAVYFAPLLLLFQLIGLFSVMVFGKYTPGFIFLISALLFLGCISLKIFFHETAKERRKCAKIAIDE